MNLALPKIRGKYRYNAVLSKTNWFGVGGPAEVLYKPEDAEDLADFIKHKADDLPVNIIGLGSNLLVRDGGIEGVVIKLGQGFTDVEIDGDIITVGTGTTNYNLANFAATNGISGFEYMIGIPGGVGGAIAMNAGAYGSETAEIVIEVEAINPYGEIHILSKEDLGFIYRGNSLKDDWLFTKVRFKGIQSDPLKIKERMQEIIIAREKTQPIHTKTSGSTFKNPQGDKKAWQLIDEAGCRGLQKNGAMVSQLHCNFLINLGNATAADIEELGEEVRSRVKAQSGVELQWEIKRVGRK